MEDPEIVVKALDPQWVAARAENVPSFEVLGSVMPRLFGELDAALQTGGVTTVGPAIAFYESSHDDDAPIRAVAAEPINDLDRRLPENVQLIELPPVERAVAAIHHGEMERVEETIQAILRWFDVTGEHADGYSREVYLDCDGPPETWVTEIQYALAPRT
jgi:effector-binding domain-containing protein